MFSFLFLTLLSLAPVYYLFRYLRHMDRAEPEPLELVTKAMKWGALSIVPVVIIEIWLEKQLFGDHPKSMGEIFVYAFVVVAAVEELAKLVAGLWPVWDDPNFNEENDGIVYVSAASLGFAGLENFFYVVSNGTGVGILRAIMAVPGHLAWGAMMGYYAGLAKFAPPHERVSHILRGYVYAVLGHGLYDAFLMSKQGVLVMIMFLAGPVYIWKTLRNLLEAGRALSLNRTGREDGIPVVTPLPEKPPEHPGTWKLVLSRFLYGVSGAFWALIAVSIYVNQSSPEVDPSFDTFAVFCGSIILTAPPILLAWLLSSSYRTHLKKYLAFRTPPPPPPGLSEQRIV